MLCIHFCSFVNFLIRQNINSSNPNRNPVQILFALKLKKKKRFVRLSIDLSWLILCGVSLIYFKLFKNYSTRKGASQTSYFRPQSLLIPKNLHVVCLFCLSSSRTANNLQGVSQESEQSRRR